MKKIIASLPMIVILTGCGGESTTSTAEDVTITEKSSSQTNSKIIVARDNTLKEVVKSFHNYQIKVVTDKSLGEDAVSKDTFAVYGEINGENTAALLKLNSNYPVGTKVTVKVYDADSKKLVGESKTFTYNGGVVNFGSIEAK